MYGGGLNTESENNVEKMMRKKIISGMLFSALFQNSEDFRLVYQ